MSTQYSFWKSFGKTVVRLAILAIPLLIHWLPATWLNLTVSGVLMLGFDWSKAKWTTL